MRRPGKKAHRARGSARILDLELSRLQPNPYQPRKNFEQSALQELADSIETCGLIQPIAVTESDGGGYTIVAGERRYRALRLLKRQTISAVILTEGSADELALVENVQRQDLHPLEEAEAMAGLMERHGYTQKELAKVIGKARPTVTNTLKLNSLPDQIREECSTSNIVTKSLLLEIAQLPSERQLSFWDAVKSGTTVQAARARKGSRRAGSRPLVQSTLNAGRSLLKRLHELLEAAGAGVDKDQLEALTDLRQAISEAISSIEKQAG